MQITKNKNRLFTLETSSKEIKTPFFFPAISSIKTNETVYDYFNLLKKVSYPGFLISAYDIYKDEKKATLLKELSELSETPVFTMMDSGNYESYWYNDKEWTFEKFESILQEINLDFCFSFDVFQKDSKNASEHIKKTITSTARTAGSQTLGVTIPLIHSNPNDFPKVVEAVVEGINPQIIGIIERELGASLFERAETLKKIRNLLDKIRPEIPIHLLGTGNPASILIYALCGADLFDALEWCKTIVNPLNGHLYHFVQKDFVKCDCRACNLKDVPNSYKTISHNLIFYEQFTKEIREAIEKRKIPELVDKYIPKTAASKVKEISLIK